MQVINGDIYRNATKVIIKDLNQIVVDGWVENDVIPWIKIVGNESLHCGVMPVRVRS